MFFASHGGHGVKQMCREEWQNNQLSFLTVPNELHRSCGQKAIPPHFCHVSLNSSPPFISSRHSSLPVSAHPPFTPSHFTGNASACWCIIANLQIMSPPLHPHPLFSVNNLSKTRWVTFASECCQSRFPPSLLKRPGEEALQYNGLDDWADQM